MTATPANARSRRLEQPDAAHVTGLLERGFGDRPDVQSLLANQAILDALDRGEHRRVVVWPGHDPIGVLYASPAGTLIPAGDPAAAVGLAEAAEGTGWRVLVGDAPISRSLLELLPLGLFRRRPVARQQRLMTLTADRLPEQPEPAGFRRARRDDLEALTELACLLHVEDLMGPPIARSAREGVRARMFDSLLRGDTWVVERGGEVVAKVDVSLRSRRRGAQIAGVYVASPWRGRGLAGGAVAALSRLLLADGAPGVTLHVRADNAPALAAYRRAGFGDYGPWTLALR